MPNLVPNENHNQQWRTQDFHLGGGEGNDQVKNLNNKIKSFKVLYKGFLEFHGCNRSCVLTIGSAPDNQHLNQYSKSN